MGLAATKAPARAAAKPAVARGGATPAVARGGAKPAVAKPAVAKPAAARGAQPAAARGAQPAVARGANPAVAKAPVAKSPVARAAPSGAAAAKPAIAAPIARDAAPGAGADPAAIVEWALCGSRRTLPHAGAVASRLGHPIDGVITLGGERAHHACELLRARAFAVDNVVAFADDAPPLDRVLHEVAHVLQRGALHAPRPRFTAGSLAVAAPGELAEREAARFARAPRPAHLSAAPRRLYREDPEVTPDDEIPAETKTLAVDGTGEFIPPTNVTTEYHHFKYIHSKRLLRIARSLDFRPNKIDEKKFTPPANWKGAAPKASKFGVRPVGTKDFMTFYAYSSDKAITTEAIWTKLSAAGAAGQEPPFPPTMGTLGDDLTKARKTDAFRTTGVVIDNAKDAPRYVMRGVGSSDQQHALYFAFIGPAHGSGFTVPPDIVQTLRSAGESESTPEKVLENYQLVLSSILEKWTSATTGRPDPYPGALATTASTIDGQLKGGLPADLDARWDIVENHRKVIIPAIVNAWESIDQLHEQVIDTKGMNANSGLKGNVFETWIQKYAKVNTNTEREPIFAKPKKADEKFEKSEKLIRVRRGDGVITVNGEFIIAEAKAYTHAPSGDKDEVVLQMQDYAVIIHRKIAGWLKAPSKDTYHPITFTQIYYHFSNAGIAAAWAPYLDKYLPGLYKIVQPENYANAPTVEIAVAFYTKLLGAMKGKGVVPPAESATAVDDLLAELKALAPPKPAAAKPAAPAPAADAGAAPEPTPTDAAPPTATPEERLKAITKKLAALVAGRYAKLDELFTAVLAATPPIIVAPHLALIGEIFEAWVKDDAKLATAQSPLRGEVAETTPFFSESVSGLGLKSATVLDIVARKKSFKLLDNVQAVEKGAWLTAIVLDLTHIAPDQAANHPDDKEKAELDDYKALIVGKGRTYYQAKGGASNIVVARQFNALDFRFVDVAVADPWATYTETLFKTLPNPKDKVHFAPNPKGEKTFSLWVTSNPRIELPVKNADVLDVPLTPADVRIHGKNGVQPGDKAAGITISDIKLKLKTQRSKEIDAGSITMTVGAKDVVKSDKPATQTIKPAIEPTKPGAPPVHGALDNKITGASSALDKLLKRVQTEVKLVDGGIAATLRVLPGASGIPKVNLETAEITVTYLGGDKLTVKGSVGLKHESGKLSGKLDISWVKGALKIVGSVTGQPGLIDGLEGFTGEIEYTKTETPGVEGAPATTEESLKIRVKEAKVKKVMKGVTLTGSAKNLEYDAMTGLFSGQIEKVSAEMGPFGTATGTASFKDSELSDVTLTYASPELVYPKKSPTPLLKGKLTTTVAYKDGKFSGGVTGDVALKVGALDRLRSKKKGAGPAQPLGLKVDVKISEEGAWSGSIGTTSAIELGEYFKIPSITLTLAENGDVSGKFGLTIHDIKYLKEATAECTIDRAGFTVKAFAITGEIPKEEKSRFWGTIHAKYASGSFTIGIDAFVKLRENLIGHGWLTYDSQTNTISGGLEVEKIQLLGPSSKDYELFNFDKQIVLFTVYGVIGLYLDVGVNVAFKLGYDVWLKPTLTLKDFSLTTFKFKSIGANMVVGGQLSASLTVEPKVGLGLFVLSPKIVRAGGGLKVPITAKATVDATAEAGVSYEPKDPNDENSAYELKAGAAVSLVIKFGINAAIKAYAEFVLLDGAYKLPWEETLATFPLMPERELMRYTIDFGKPLTKGADPAAGPGAAPPKDAKQSKPPTGSDARDTKADKTVPEKNAEELPAGKSPETPSGNSASDGFSMKSLLDQVKKLPVYKKIESIIDSAAGVFRAIGDFFKKIYNTVKKWLGDGIAFIENAMKKIADPNIGLFGWLHGFIDARIRDVSPGLADAVTPLFLALRKSEAQLRDALFGAEPVTTIGGFITLALEIIPILMGGAWDSATAIVDTLYTLYQKGKSAGLRFINELIANGKLGVMAGTGASKYGYKIYIGPVASEGYDDAASRAIATALYVVLEKIGATKTNDAGDFWAANVGD